VSIKEVLDVFVLPTAHLSEAQADGAGHGGRRGTPTVGWHDGLAQIGERWRVVKGRGSRRCR